MRKAFILILLLLATHQYISAQIDFAGSNLEELQQIAEKRSAQEVALSLSDLGVLLSLAGVPAGPLEKLDHLAIKFPVIEDAPPEMGKGFGVRGSILFTGKEVDLTVWIVKQSSGDKGFSIMLGLPSNWRMSDLSPSLAKLDQLSLPSGRFIIASFDYREPTFNIKVKKGLNFISGLKLAGPLEALGNLINQKGKLGGSLVLKGGDIVFQGVIPRDIKQSQFGAEIPLKVGVDFTKIKNLPPDITKFIEQITLDSISFYVTPPPTLTFGLKGNISLKLGTQATPLIFSATSIVAPQSMAFVGEMEGLLQLFWFAVGDAAMQIDVDIPIVSSLASIGVPIPFSGISIRGSAAIGKEGPTRATINLAGGFKLKSDGIPTDFVFEGEGINLHFSELIVWLADRIKKPIDPGKIPDIIIKRAQVYVVPPPNAVRIGDKLYEPGFVILGDGLLGKVNMDLDFRLDPVANLAKGSGHISPIITKQITFTGKGRDRLAGTEDDGAYLEFVVPAENPLNMRFSGSGLLEIPALEIKQGIDFVLSPLEIDASFVGKAGGKFSMDMSLDLPVKSPEQFSIEFNFQQDFIDYFYDQIKKQIPRLMTHINGAINHINQALKEAESMLGKQSGILDQKAEKEVKNLKNQIDALEKEIAAHKKICATKKIKLTKDCIAIASKEIKKIGLLSAYKSIEVGAQAGGKALDFAQTVAQTIQRLQEEKRVLEHTASIFKTIITGLNEGLRIFQIKQVTGSAKGEELKEGKLPRLDIFEAVIALPKQPEKKILLQNLQFDFKHPQNSIRNILEQIVSNIS